MQSYNDWNFNRPYGAALPRPADLFTSGAFGPMAPIVPVGIDEPDPQSGRPDPRRMQYPVGWNLPVGVPGSEGIKLTTFANLRALADTYSVARSCVDRRIKEILQLKWDIVPTASATQAMKADPDMRADWEKRRREAVHFFRRPDSDKAKYPTFGSWLSALLEDRFVIDAVAIHLHPPRVKGAGPFRSDLASLDLLDGTTIRPMLDLAGATPPQGNVAYQQYLWGVPRVDLTTIISGDDIVDMPEPVKEYRSDQLMYLRSDPRAWTPYGFGPVEKALLPISIGLARQQYQWDFFQEGSIPGQFVTPGPDISTPQQIRQLQDALNAMAGDIGNKHRIIVLPPGSKTDPQKAVALADQFDEWIISQVAMPFGLTPMDLGVTPRVSAVQTPSESKQLSEINTDSGASQRIEPVTTQLKADLFDFVLHEIFGQHDMEWSWGLTNRGDQKDDEIKQHVSMTQGALESIDEARVAMGKNPWGLPETSVPLMMTATGPVPLTVSVATAQAQAQNAANQGAQGQPAVEAKPKPPELTTPAHEAAQAASAGTPPTAKAIRTDVEIYARHIRKGRPRVEFISDLLTADVLEVVDAELPKGLAAAATAAAGAIRRKLQTVRRNALAAVMHAIAEQLGRLVSGYRSGAIGTMQFVDQGTHLLTDGYRHAMEAGTRDAAADHPNTLTLLTAVDVQAKADEQRGFLGGLLRAVMGEENAETLAPRVQQYACTLQGAYNASYGMTVEESHPEYEIVWRLGDTEHCPLCLARDGKSYTFESLPGWPGDGGFGGPLCEGGPNCGCSLEYRENGKVVSVAHNTQRTQQDYYREQNRAIQQARRDAEQARQEMVDQLPNKPGADGTSTQGRALSRDEFRKQVADLVNQRIRESGGYTGVSVEPSDIPARIIAQLLPPAQRGALKDVPQISLDQAVDQFLNVKKAARGYDLSPRSGMISLDLPEGLIEPVPGGVDDHHVTVIYLGSDVDDEAFAAACARARTAAAAITWPLTGRVEGVDSFEPSEGSDGMRPAFARVALPGVEALHGQLADLSASQHPGYHPHVTLAYVEDGDPLPDPVPPTSVEFTHLSVHRGDDVVRIPFGVTEPDVTKSQTPGEVAQQVFDQLKDDYPPDHMAWVTDGSVRWEGPKTVPLNDVDFSHADRWQASHEPDKVKKFAKWIKKGKVKPVILVSTPDPGAMMVVDGHHRSLAYQSLNRPVIAYVGYTTTETGPWDEFHSCQLTGHGTKAEPVEKVGPKGYIHGWIFVGAPGVGAEVHSPDHGHGVVTHSSGSHVAVKFDSGETHSFEHRPSVEPAHLEPRAQHPGIRSGPADKVVRDRSAVKDMSDEDLRDADRDLTERAAMLGKPGQVSAPHKAIKDELARRAKPVKKSERTPMLSSTPHLLGTHGLWGDPNAKLPDYIENIAAALMGDGHSKSEAIQLAVAAVKRWAAGGDKVTPEVRAAAAKAVAEWEALKAEHNKSKG